ncbi:MAG: hypothetical protein HZA28_08280 [Candidatus Omnitrophica bacterium]|nr:hypothetical protein [Candidatus Omnitrophota bacterium]
MNKPDHSDFLISWTGKDIDTDERYKVSHPPTQETTLNEKIIEPYLERLKFTLRHGLWMMTGGEYVESGNQKIKRPPFSRTCFTELKLSEAQEHAEKFGQLGIGFKRMFVFERMGLPMLYFRPGKDNWFTSPVLWDGSSEIKEYWACFLKSMDEEWQKPGYVNYKQFEESEWRIIFSKEIKKRLEAKKLDYPKCFKSPDEINDPEFKEYLARQKKKPDFLVPLADQGKTTSRWFAMIIYPSLAVKVAAEASPEIRQEIECLKPTLKPSDTVSTSASYERYSKPMEINLSACRNF